MIDLKNLNRNLKERLAEYRLVHKQKEISVHLNAIDIATSLVEYAIYSDRLIKEDEKKWFEASYYVSYVLDGGEWEDLSNMYSQICDYLQDRNYVK